jgi:CheY-like chemotaxis protein
MIENPIEGPQAKILLVDDVAANLRMLRDTLSPEGYEILIANSGEMALKAVADTPPDLILLDITMPDMDGYEVCLRLKKDPSTRHIPVIFITARNEMESLIDGFRAGSVDYITKPFAKEEVLM